MSRERENYPEKRCMNLYYKPDRTTKPATIALYALFALVCLLALSKIMIYDLWTETREAEEALAVAETQLDGVMAQLQDYDEIQEKYFRYSATDEEKALTDRMEILRLIDSAVGSTAQIDSISISKEKVQLQFYGVSLAQAAQIVKVLEVSPIVDSTTVNTASAKPGSDTLVMTNVVIWLKKGGGEQ